VLTPVAVETRSRENAQKNSALGCPTNDDLNFSDIFYPQILAFSGETGLFQTPILITLNVWSAAELQEV
jgi:hypothetical protein